MRAIQSPAARHAIAALGLFVGAYMTLAVGLVMAAAFAIRGELLTAAGLAFGAAVVWQLITRAAYDTVDASIEARRAAARGLRR
ncbi:hypothetical protein [Pseudonocardia sp. NPDC049635]|uniref:hypothetical protein n=1 Tax=Pseudonocardia sp. NPDC049635 TaxID=3155506 RepID=UPI0033D8329B